MFDNQSDLLANFLHQTHSGKMSLTTLIQNLPDQRLPDIPEIIYDSNGRYLKLKKTHRDNGSIENSIHHRSDSGPPVLAIKRETSKLSIEERCNYVANQFNLPLALIKQQYELALKNRIEIPPLLMRRIIIDAIGIVRLMRNEFNQDQEKNAEKFQRISKHLSELDTYNQLFDHHC